MASEDDNRAAPPSGDEPAAPPAESPEGADKPAPAEPVYPAGDAVDPYNYYDDGYGYEPPPAPPETPPEPVRAVAPVAPPPSPPAPPAAAPDDEEDDGMLRMSFMEHLEELRTRLIRAIAGVGIAFLVSLIFTNELWKAVIAPASAALRKLGLPPELVFTSPTEAFTIIWVKLPILTAIFIASPWIGYQVWSFIAPGLYKKERRWAAPFIICTAGLFILGGLFSYFVLFRFALTFLLGIGLAIDTKPMITITEYFNIFINVTLGVGLVFELPILIFFLSLLRIITVSFLLRNTRYAVLLIVVAAAVITPTPDVINLTLFSVPMILLYFVGVMAAWILELQRGQRGFPWIKLMVIAFILAALGAGGVYLAVARYGFKLVQTWPFLVR